MKQQRFRVSLLFIKIGYRYNKQSISYQHFYFNEFTQKNHTITIRENIRDVIPFPRTPKNCEF